MSTVSVPSHPSSGVVLSRWWQLVAAVIAMVALGLGLSWLIGRSITRPLNGLASVMKRLADGDTSAKNARDGRSASLPHVMSNPCGVSL